MKIDQLVRSHRKTIAIIVRVDGKIIVRAPLRTSEARIMAFVAEKQPWIESRLAQVQLRQEQIRPRLYQVGEVLPYLGHLFPLVLVDGVRPALSFTGDEFRLSKSAQTDAPQLFAAWYQKQACQVIDVRVKLYTQRFHLEYTRLRISSARTRWGSCSTSGTLSFTWRLVMAPLEVIDYVVIHELAHLVEHNHSQRFWNRVAAMMPGFQQHLKWLKANGSMLTLDTLPPATPLSLNP